MKWYVERQKITHRSWPIEPPAPQPPAPTPPEIFEFDSLNAALRAYCDYILEGHERVMLRKHNRYADNAGHIAVYNRTMDELEY